MDFNLILMIIRQRTKLNSGQLRVLRHAINIRKQLEKTIAQFDVDITIMK